jgi:hypothetical protein
VAPQPFPGLTGIDYCLAQTLRNEIIIAAKNLLQNPKHQGIPEFLQPIERSEDRRDTRAGHYERKLQTNAKEVELKVPKLRQLKFETAIIERYRRREASVEEALIEMYLAGGYRCGE